MIYANLDTPLGAMVAVVKNEALFGLWFDRQKYYPADNHTWIHDPSHPVFRELGQWLSGYFAGHDHEILIDLQPEGTEFRQAVWQILRQIPYGQVTTYGQIAVQVAEARGLPSMSAQAVGGAVGHNPISILIPCHRVVGSDGSLTGFGGGLDRKQALLQLEGANMAQLSLFPHPQRA